MPQWRAQTILEFGASADAKYFEMMARPWESGVVDSKPFDFSTSPGGSSAAGHIIASHTFCNSEADARMLHQKHGGFISDPLGRPMGEAIMGMEIPPAAILKGKVSLHLCTHGDTVVKPCNAGNASAQYEEILV